jgi:hypothetical protein
MKSKWTVEYGKKSEHFDERDDAVKFIAKDPMAVTCIKHYNRLTSSAIEVFKEGLRYNKKVRPNH